VFRKLIAVGLAAAVQAAALGAPLVHAHLGGHDSDHHHGHQAVHAHLSGHSWSHQNHGNRPTIDDNDGERTVYLQLFVALDVAAFQLPPAVVSSFDLTVPVAAAPRAVLHVVHGHDPPSGRSLSSRAPPAFLS